MPSYSGPTPTKGADAQYTYSFDSWSPTIVAATSNATYTATYSTTVNTYTVTWKNEDGTVLEVDSGVPYGTTPTYDGATPTKEGGYVFSGWNPGISVVTGDTIYTATYSEPQVITYTITWKNMKK